MVVEDLVLLLYDILSENFRKQIFYCLNYFLQNSKFEYFSIMCDGNISSIL